MQPKTAENFFFSWETHTPCTWPYACHTCVL